MKCPHLHFIEDYLNSELQDDERRKFELHLSSCPVCRGILEEEKSLDSVLRSQQLIQAPAGFSREVVAALPKKGIIGKLPDWTLALAMGLVVTFIGLMVGRFGAPFGKRLMERVASFFSDFNIIPSLGKLEPVVSTEWYQQITGGSNILALNFVIAAIILCWGLWQMVKALRN